MRWHRICWLSLMLAFMTGCSGGNDASKVRAARAQLQALTTALRSYAAARGDYPDDLHALAEASEAVPAPVDGSALLDPWGRPYHYEPHVRHPTDGTPLVYSDGPSPGDVSRRVRNWTEPDEAPAEPPPPVPADPELRVAQSVAEEFLGHALARNLRAARALSTPEFQRRWGLAPVDGINPLGESDLEARLAAGYTSWRLSSSVRSAAGDGAVFGGKLAAARGERAEFTLRLVKEKTDGRWKVDGLDVRGPGVGR